MSNDSLATSATRRIGHKGPYRMGEVFPGERVSVRDSDGWVVAEATAQEFAERIVAALNSALSQSSPKLPSEPPCQECKTTAECIELGECVRRGPRDESTLPSSTRAPVTRDGPLGGFATLGQEAAELDFMLAQLQLEIEGAASDDISIEEAMHHGAEALKLKREIIERYTPRSAISPMNDTKDKP